MNDSTSGLPNENNQRPDMVKHTIRISLQGYIQEKRIEHVTVKLKLEALDGLC